jgi:hypothetical protein
MQPTHWADTHETDYRIAEAIADLADGDTNVAERIWQEPTDEEVDAIYAYATRYAMDDRADEMAWGVTTLAEAMKQREEGY